MVVPASVMPDARKTPSVDAREKHRLNAPLARLKQNLEVICISLDSTSHGGQRSALQHFLSDAVPRLCFARLPKSAIFCS